VTLFAGTASAVDFIEFESGPVRPLAMSPDGTRLFAVNTPDARLEIFSIGAGGIAKTGSVSVGLEPVTVVARTNGEVWVVNHLSDSVSIVNVASSPARVTRTLLVGDEPRDLVFAGPADGRAFITTAHRGQHRLDPSLVGVVGAGDPQLTTASVGRADVWIFDSANLGTAIGGVPLRIVTLFGDTPRALAVKQGTIDPYTPDTVYAAVLASGNKTTTVSEGMVCNGFNLNSPCTNSQGLQTPGGVAPPSTDHLGNQAPEVGVIVKFNESNSKWEDERGRDFSAAVRFTLPDSDVFAIDADTMVGGSIWSGVGTTLFNMVVNPVNKKVYVSNTEAKNEVRFEGPGTYVTNQGSKPIGEPATVQGHLAESRVTVLDGASVLPRHLNKHIDYTVLPAPSNTSDHSLATPVEMAVSSDGLKLYVAAFGSSKVGVFDTATLENNSFDPTLQSAQYLPVSGGGPGGLVLDEARNRLYVLTRFDNSVSVIDLGTSTETSHVALFNPEPAAVVTGRPFLYDAVATSSNGEASCSSCHTFGDMDQLAWDLGNPDDEAASNPMPIRLGVAAGSFPNINGTGVTAQFSALKGPMTTQTLRGMKNSGPMHWRGDRSNGFFGQSATDEDLSFRNFIVAFPGLVGRSSLLSNTDMQSFSDFQLQVILPPNPVRNIDNSLTAAQANGRNFFLGQTFTSGGPSPSTTGVGGANVNGRRADGANSDTFGFTCQGCHGLDASQGFFGTDGQASFENESQIQKIPHMRNLYQKVGMFGMPDVAFNNVLNTPHQGNQVRGFGFLHDGSTDTVFRFFQATVFNQANPFNLGTVGFTTNANGGNGVRRDVEHFALAFDSDLAPVVGQQVTLSSTNSAVVNPRIATFIARAGTAFVSQVLGAGQNECDLVVKGTIGGVAKGWQYLPGTGFRPSDGGPDIADATLRANATVAGQELTYTCATPGSGQRAGIDRDRDADLDGADNCVDVANASQADGDVDLRGDSCDNCALKANAAQSDVDADGNGDVCDNQCIANEVTTLTSVTPANAIRGQNFQLIGTGFGPSVSVFIGNTQVTPVLFSGNWLAQVPASMPVATYPVRVVNPEGCESQEAISLQVTAGGGCGLTGIEPFLLLGLLGVRRLYSLVA
jgi:DNA-binding beta-propeller fold protein YncE